jgi:DNA-binding NarL/FixJ family response regulator
MVSAGPAVRVVVVDDHTLFREGLRELLCTDHALTVVAEGGTGDAAVSLVTEHRPDVLLLDVEMPGLPARTVIRKLAATHPLTSIVVLTMHDDAALVHELLDSGACAFLTKTIGRSELIAAVHSVSRSRRNVLLSVPRETIEGLDRQRGVPLSEREREVLDLLAQARSNAQIGAQLFITEGTVKRHLTNIYAKLGAVSRVDALRKATAARLISAAQTPSTSTRSAS